MIPDRLIGKLSQTNDELKIDKEVLPEIFSKFPISLFIFIDDFFLSTFYLICINTILVPFKIIRDRRLNVYFSVYFTNYF